MARELRLEADGAAVRFSHPDKVLFPEQGFTKLDVARHYLACGEGALRAVYGRPCVLLRWVRGVGADPFFQKRAPRSPGHEYARIRFPSGRSAELVVPRRLADLIWMVQLNCIDFHPWPVRAEDVDRPDELRLDLDPTEGVDFASVRDVAVECGHLLRGHGLVGWPKTSGARGIHIMARIHPRWTFGEVRRAALALARAVEARMPGVATTAWWKRERRGVFIDYNQNARDRTVASAYSVRATGLVSAPLRWSEVPRVNPRDFSLPAFAERYREVGDLTAGIDEQAGSLEPLLALAAEQRARGLRDAPWPPRFPRAARDEPE